MYKLEMLYWNFLCRMKELPLLLKGNISFNYWLNLNTSFNVWIYSGLDLKNGNSDNRGFDFDLEHEEVFGYRDEMKLISENVYQFEDGSIIYNPEHKGIYLKQDDTFVKCTIEDNKLIPVPKEQIILDFPKAEIIRLRNKAKEKNLSLKDYLTNQINSIL